MTDQLLPVLLLGLLLPLWLLTGWLDAACHSRLQIEHSSGLYESRLHLVMLAQLAIGVGAALLLKVTAGALALMLLAALLHEATLLLDLAYAESTRRVPWFEQWIHGMQQAMPWGGLAGLVLLHPGQTLALFGLGTEAADWALRSKAPALPWWYLGAVTGVGLRMAAWPFVAEYLRCRRTESRERY